MDQRDSVCVHVCVCTGRRAEVRGTDGRDWEQRTSLREERSRGRLVRSSVTCSTSAAEGC